MIRRSNSLRACAAAAAVVTTAALLAGCGKGYDEWDSQQMCELLTKDEAKSLVEAVAGDEVALKVEPDRKNSLMYSPGCHFDSGDGQYIAINVHHTMVKQDGEKVQVAGTEAVQEPRDDGCTLSIPLEDEGFYFWVLVTSYVEQDDCKTALKAAEAAYPRFESG